MKMAITDIGLEGEVKRTPPKPQGSLLMRAALWINKGCAPIDKLSPLS